MKVFKKFLICIIGIIIIIMLNTKATYALTDTGKIEFGDLFNYKINDLIGEKSGVGMRMDDENDSYGPGYTNCCEHMNGGKYSIYIATVYETVYDGVSGTIVGNSLGRELYAVPKSKVKNNKVRKLAAALSLPDNIRGVRDALLKCLNQNDKNKSILTYSAALSKDNYDGINEYSGSGDEWEASNAKLIDAYTNYKKMKKIGTGVTPTMDVTTVDNVEYVKLGPFKMQFGTAKMKGYSINGVDLTGKGVTYFQYENGTLEQYANKGNVVGQTKKGKDILSETSFQLSEQKFYFLVKKSYFDEKIAKENTSKLKVKFTQKKYTYRKGRAVICQNYIYNKDAGQASAWYESKEVKLNGGKVQYKINYESTGEKVKVTKVNPSGEAVSGVGLTIYGGNETNKGWIDDNGALTSNFDEACVYKTGTDGVVLVDELPKGKYYVYEVGVPDGYNLEDQRAVYPNSSDPNGFAGKDDYDNCVYLSERDSSATPDEGKITQYPLGSITIQKVISVQKNGKTEEQGVSNIGLKIYGQTSVGSGWIVEDGTVRNFMSEATVYTTGTDGKATVSNLRRGTYYIYETSVPEPYHLDEQRNLYPNWKDPLGVAGKAEYDNCVYLGSTTCASEPTDIKFNQKQTAPKQLDIIKKDENTGKTIEGAGFKVLMKLSRYLVQDGIYYKSGDYVWLKSDGKVTSNIAEASEVKTGNTGVASISGIYARGQSYVYETTMPAGYLVEDQTGYMQGKPGDYVGTFLSGTWVYSGSVTLGADDTTPIGITVYNKKVRGNLQITKYDISFEQEFRGQGRYYLGGARVKIYGVTADGTQRGWVKPGGLTVSGAPKYDLGSYNEASEFTTMEGSGVIYIPNLKFGTYYIYETKAPDGYDIKEQDGYLRANVGSSELTNTHWVSLGSANVNYLGNSYTTYVEVRNWKYTSITGKVWVDNPDGKDADRDFLYKVSSQDVLLGGIKVNLYDLKTDRLIATTTTNSNGEYEIKTDQWRRKITYWQASHYYVEFEYDNTKYITVAIFQGDKNMIAYNSKAQEIETTEEDLDDAKLTGTAGENPGRAVTYKETNMNAFNRETIRTCKNAGLERMWLIGYYNDTSCKIENINLGLIQKVDPDHQVTQTIEYVRLVRGNYTFKYKYGDEAVTEQGDLQSTVALGNINTATFTQGLYPSDIKYNIANGLNGNSNDAYKVYVVYKVTVYNSTNVSIDYLHDEKLFNIESLTDTFDTAKYEFSTDKDPNDYTGIPRDFDKWTVNGDTATYDLNDYRKMFHNGLRGGLKETAYIQFKVKDEALRSVLDGDLNIATTVKAKGYHTYTRRDLNWKDRQKLNNHTSIHKEKANSALSIKLKLFDTRTISGTIYEDTKEASRPNELIGNGRYEAGSEKTLTEYNDKTSNKYSVIVSLIDAEAYGRTPLEKIAYLYEDDLEQNPASGKWTRCKQKAVTRIDENGYYAFKGVVPGKYYLQFTYGDGKVVTTDLNGNQVDATVATKIKGENQVINSNYYKSTIRVGPSLNSDYYSKWFVDGMNEGGYSIASDSYGTYYDKDGNQIGAENVGIIASRINSTKEINSTSSQDKVVINATSPRLNIDFEYIVGIEYQVTNNQLNDLKSNCTGLDFGIIERPHVDIQLEETIQNVKFTLSNGTTIVNGNPLDQNVSSYITGYGNGRQARLEIEDSKLYGSSLEITYKITAINKSDLNYAASDYYTQGKIGEGDEVIATTINKMINYVSQKGCNYVTPSIEDDKIQFSDEYTNSEGYTKKDYYEEGVIDANKNYNGKLLIAGSNSIIPEKANKGNSSVDFMLKVSKLMPSSNSNEDMGWVNYTELLAMTNKTFTPQYTSHMGSYKIEDEGTSEPDNSYAVITVTPPTGQNRNYIVYIIITGALVVLAGGVVLIKKFVV